jgi:hypothetical protein
VTGFLTANEVEVDSDHDGSGPTGHSRVDEAMDAMSRGADLTPAEQVGVYESVHGALQETLRTIEEG